MKRFKIFLMLIAIGFGAASCEDFTDGINVNPNAFTSAPGNLLVGQAELVVVKLSSSQSSRVSGIFTDQFTGFERQYESYDQYLVNANDFNDDWDDIYADGVAQARQAKEAGIETGDDLLAGVATIMEALMMGETAALWGDVPYRAAFDYFENPDPTYDPQAQVLSDVQELLSSAITLVGDAKVANVYGDPVFVKTNASWAEVAHTLKARYYMVAKDYANAYVEAQQGISSADGDLLSRHGIASGERNLYYSFLIEERGGYLRASNPTTNEPSNLVKLMTGERARVLATPGDAVRFPLYFTDLGDDGIDLNASSSGYFAIDASFPIVSYVENKLIEAEAAARTGGDALTPFNEVRAHLADTYGGDFPASSSTGDQLILEILEEKYVSMPGSLQVFHDARRTQNALDIPIKNETAPNIPQRFVYPQVEINANDNFPGLVDLFEPTPVNQ